MFTLHAGAWECKQALPAPSLSSPLPRPYVISLTHTRKPHPCICTQACGSGGTTAGWALGAHLAGLSARVRAYGVCDDPQYFYDYVDGLYQGGWSSLLCACVAGHTACCSPSPIWAHTDMCAPTCMHAHVCTHMYAPICMHPHVCTHMYSTLYAPTCAHILPLLPTCQGWACLVASRRRTPLRRCRPRVRAMR